MGELLCEEFVFFVADCMVCKFEAGEITELHEYYDQLDLLMQLGLMP